jgi:hypothetical protein
MTAVMNTVLHSPRRIRIICCLGGSIPCHYKSSSVTGSPACIVGRALLGQEIIDRFTPGEFAPVGMSTIESLIGLGTYR